MKEIIKERIIKAIYIIVPLIIIGFMVQPAIEKFKTNQEGYTCYEKVCSKTTLDGFNSCQDLGRESTGFLSSQQYYLCDGNKIPYNCLEYNEVKTNKTTIQFGMECRKDEVNGK